MEHFSFGLQAYSIKTCYKFPSNRIESAELCPARRERFNFKLKSLVFLIMITVTSFLGSGIMWAQAPMAFITFPSNGATNVARQMNIPLITTHIIDTSKLFIQINERSYPAVILIDKKTADIAPRSLWRTKGLRVGFEIIDPQKIILKTPYLNFNTEYILVVDSLKYITGIGTSGGGYPVFPELTRTFTTITNKAHYIPLISTDFNRRIKCNDTLFVAFNQPVSSINTPLGKLVEIRQKVTPYTVQNNAWSFNTTSSNTTLVTEVSIPSQSWIDPSGKIVCIKPIAPYQNLGDYSLVVNGHYLNGDEHSKYKIQLFQENSFKVSMNTRVEYSSSNTSSADTLPSNLFTTPKKGESIYFIGEEVKLFAEYRLGNYRFKKWESNIASINNKTDQYGLSFTLPCDEIYPVNVTAVYEKLTPVKVKFVKPTHGNLEVMRNGGISTNVNDSITLSVMPDKLDSVWANVTPNLGYSFSKWEVSAPEVMHNGSMIGSGPPKRNDTNSSILIKGNMYENYIGFGGDILYTPVLDTIPEEIVADTTDSTKQDTIYSCNVVVTVEDEDAMNTAAAIAGISWRTPTSYTSKNKSISAPFIAVAPDCYKWISEGTMNEDSSIITHPDVTTNPHHEHHFKLQRRKIALKVELRVVADVYPGIPLNEENEKFEGTDIFEITNNVEQLINSAVEYDNENGPNTAPFKRVVKKCGTPILISNRKVDIFEQRENGDKWARFDTPNLYIAPSRLSDKDYPFTLNREITKFRYMPDNIPEVRARCLWLTQLELKYLGLHLLQKNGEFKHKWYDWKREVLTHTFADSVDLEGGEASLKWQYNMDFVFNKKISENLGNGLEVTSLEGINPDSLKSIKAVYGSNFHYAGMYDPIKGLHQYTLETRLPNRADANGYIQKMSDIRINIRPDIKNQNRNLSINSIGTPICSMEMPEVELSLPAQRFMYDGDDWSPGEIFNYYLGGEGSNSKYKTQIKDSNSLLKDPVGKGAYHIVNADLVSGKAEWLFNNMQIYHANPRIGRKSDLFGFISTYEEDCGDESSGQPVEDENCAINKVKNVADNVKGFAEKLFADTAYNECVKVRYMRDTIIQLDVVSYKDSSYIDSTGKTKHVIVQLITRKDTIVQVSAIRDSCYTAYRGGAGPLIGAGIDLFKAVLDLVGVGNDDYMGQSTYIKSRRDKWGLYDTGYRSRFNNWILYVWGLKVY